MVIYEYLTIGITIFPGFCFELSIMKFRFASLIFTSLYGFVFDILDSPKFPLTHKYAMNKNNTFSAGYANMKDIKWFAPSWLDFITIYGDARNLNPPKSIDKSIEIKAASTLENQDWQIVPTLNEGTYRITKIIVNVKQAWRPNTMPSLILYTKKYDVDPDGQELQIATMVGLNNGDPLTVANIYESHPYVFVVQKAGVDTSIRLKFNQTLVPNIRGQMTVVVGVERLSNQIIPNDMVWCYNTGTTGLSWQIYKLYDGARKKEYRPPDFL